ncbi:hypothetical protein ACTNBL_03840 [Enterococcus villorum]|uniref:Lipoprotein n=2 Tax=Enterococcus villorum TaxID=112904 RepID=A0A511IZH2_9ENTE|nr:hypothetical protein [Enterococcus villorum]EOH89289.1 hypothetical protein UAO_01559 [Enterococcus villorum ATCC 700913]EOW76097.1 hypothetical protein I591_01398 [Enterococcus villorum ATCC 700913]GEL91151.1 hypothetical protein EVI01_04880 [Enterococcus villorum]
MKKKGIVISTLTLFSVLLVGCGSTKTEKTNNSKETETSISLNEEGKKEILDSSKEVKISE